jgi:3-methyladenine DNA glycosylase AlkD
MHASPGAPRLSRRQLERDLAAAADPQRAANLAWFFKTGRGQDGEGDRFIGIPVPVQRRIALRYRGLALDDIAELLRSPVHEHRFTALEVLVAQYERAGPILRNCAGREKIFEFYLEHLSGVNNWDLVDTSAPFIVGAHLLHKRSRRLLDRLAGSGDIWTRRVAIVSTLALIKHGETEDTFRIARKLLADRHDLIQKACGWALREAGKVSRAALVSFLREHYASLPRTTLRYAIERFPPERRKRMLGGDFEGL